jgi:helix-turn-helix, Psq domain
MSEVSWETFLAYPDGDDKFSETWLLSPANVVSLFPDGGAYCRLCDSYFTGSPAEHVTKHETSLRTWREKQGRNGKVSDSDIKEKLDKAVMLLDEGLSQRQAAAIAGIPRSNLQRRLQEAA